MVIGLLESSAFGAAFAFGIRHGFDWDHVAALTDLTGSQATTRRSMWLGTLYALGHAVMVLVLGAVAILFVHRVPGAVDLAMERLVGLTLLGLGIWIAWTAVRSRGAPPVRSRWMLLLEATQRMADRRARGEESLVIEHAHRHDHHQMHQHPHVPADAVHAEGPGTQTTEVAVQHSHTHRHVAVVPRDPFMAYGSWSSFGIGLLHGVGAETPTQVLVFAAAAHASGRPTSIGLLLCFIAGLLAANTLVAVASTFGFRRVVRHRLVAIVLAAATASFSLVVGSLLLVGRSATLPTILGG